MHPMGQRPIHPQSTAPKNGRKSLIVSLILLAVVLCIVWAGYKAYDFYQTNIAGMVQSVTSGEIASTEPAKIQTQLKKLGFHKLPAAYAPLLGFYFDFMGQKMARIVVVPKEMRPKLVKKNPTAQANETPIVMDDVKMPDPFKTDLVQVEFTQFNNGETPRPTQDQQEQILDQQGLIIDYEKTFTMKINGKARQGLRQKRTRNGQSYDYFEIKISDALVVYGAGPWGKFDRKSFLTFLRGYKPAATPAH